MDLAALWPAISLTLMLAAINTLILLVVGTPVAWWLVRSRSRYREAIGAIVTMPLVLPPTVLGYYLLVSLGAASPIGAMCTHHQRLI